MAESYVTSALRGNLRLPLEGQLDLTYRCNNNCRHCWLRIPVGAEEKKKELSFSEITSIIDETRAMGCRRWSISGGEPMLRPDFAGLFDYITSHAASYSLNTNGTLITPAIARLLKRKGAKMVALYGATADVHDHITRKPGSFAATMAGFRYLKEAGAGFCVQLIPMRDNYHQFSGMMRLARSLSPQCKIGAPWLNLSACGDKKKNAEIRRQRLDPEQIVDLDTPDVGREERPNSVDPHKSYGVERHHFSRCIEFRRDFHIDPYGRATFCSHLAHPDFRYNLRKGSFRECWEEFIPSLARKARKTKEYRKNCGSCSLREECRICPVYGYLEHHRFDAKVDYLCQIAKAEKRHEERWQREHRRYFKIADMTIQVESDLPFKEDTFDPKFRHFEAAGPSDDMISFRHSFSLPDLKEKDLGMPIYRKAPWAIYRKDSSWYYLGISQSPGDTKLLRAAVFNNSHTRSIMYNASETAFREGGLSSLTFFSTDQVLLARVLADRAGFYLHSCGVDLEGRGFLFIGHSGAGKSTVAASLKEKGVILSDDRIIVRRTSGGYRIYGTWCHGDVPDVSSSSAPLSAIFFLTKSDTNRAVRIQDKKLVVRKLLACLIKPFVTVDWWEKVLALIDDIPGVIPCYDLYFDKSGAIEAALKRL